MLAFAEYERGMIVERTQTGKNVARLNPEFHDGRPRKYTDAQIQLGLELLTAGKSYGQVQKMTGISKSTLVRARHMQTSSTSKILKDSQVHLLLNEI